MPDYRPSRFSLSRTLWLASALMVLGLLVVSLLLMLNSGRDYGSGLTEHDREPPVQLGDGPFVPRRKDRPAPSAKIDLSSSPESAIDVVLAVTDADDRGVPSRVRLSLLPAAPAVSSAAELPGEDEPTPIGFAVASTDQDGRLLVWARAGKFRLVITPHDTRVAPFLGNIAIDADSRGKEFGIRRDLRHGAIHGSVRGLERGSAAMRLDAGTQGNRTISVGADGSFAFEHVPAGHHHLELDLGAFAAHYLPLQPITCYLAEDQVRRDLVIELCPAAVLKGVVSDRSGHPVAGVRVQARAAVGERMTQAVSDERGAYRLPSLDPGRHTVAVLHPWSERALIAAPMTVAAAVGEGELSFPIDAERAVMRGRVVGPDGEPVQGARIAAVLPSTLRLGEQVTGVDGDFTIDGLMLGPYPLLVVTDAGYRARSEIVLQATLDPSVQLIRLERTATLVIVPKARAMAIGPWHVTVRGEDAFFRAQEYPGDSTELEMAGLPPGSMEVRLALGEASQRREQLWHVQLEAGGRERLEERD